MNAEPKRMRNGPVVFVPLAFGVLGLLIAATYQAQRGGAFLDSFYSRGGL